MSQSSIDPMRLAIARRLYLYGVALISYLLGLAALHALVYIVEQSWYVALGSPLDTALHSANFGVFYRDALASNGGLLLVAAPIFLVHWGYAQSLARRSADEAGAGMRKFFLYVALVAAIIYGLVAAYRVLTGLGMLAVGAPTADSALWPTGWLHAGMTIAMSVALARYFATVLFADGDFGQEEGLAGFWRRLYQTGAGLASLALIVLGGSEALNAIWQLFTGLLAFTAGDLWWRTALVNGLSLLLMGGFLLRLNWRQWQDICARHPAERGKGLRRFYLYGAVVIGALATLVPAAGLLEEILRILLGTGTGDRWALLDMLGSPVSLIPIGFAIWTWHWRYLPREEAAAPSGAEAVTVRRIYYYAVAATGLALLWFGAVEVVQAGLDRAFVAGATTAADFWIDQLARGLSLLAVGAPIWAFHWRAVHAVARREDAVGLAERASGPRRVYLYGAALVGALVILAYLAQVAYRGFLWVLGDPEAAFFSPQAAGDIARSLIAAALWIVHLAAIRTDGQMGATLARPAGEAEIAGEPVPPGVPGEALPARRAALEARIQTLERELGEARRSLAELAD